jgi:hypothetical protein
MTAHDLREVRSQIDRPGAFTILKFYIDETLQHLDVELTSIDPEHVNSQQRVIGQRQLLKNLLSHFTHYVDNKIQETKDE